MKHLKVEARNDMEELEEIQGKLKKKGLSGKSHK
jgi:hypothetical protein